VQTPSSTYTTVLDGPPTDLGDPDLDNPTYVSAFDGFEVRDFEVLNLKLDIEFDAFDLTIMGATKSRDEDRLLDIALWFGVYDDVSVFHTHFDRPFDTETFEARMVSTGDGPFEWIAGVWYENEEGFLNQHLTLQTTRTDLSWQDGDILWNRIVFDDTEETAAYGEVGYRFNDRAKLTLGYRQSNLKLDSGVISADGVIDGGFAGAIGVDESTEEDIDTYKVNFEYRFNDDVLTYATASSGYRAGGWNRSGLLGVSEASQYDTDTLWNYEVGVRSSWLESRLIVNAVVYYIDWTDIQLRTFDTATLTPKIQNVGAAEIYGLETEIRYQATDYLLLSANYAYTDSRLSEDLLDHSTVPPSVSAAKGARLPGSSDRSVSLLIDWRRPLTPSIDLQANATYIYMGSRASSLLINDTSTTGGFGDVPSHEITNVAAGLAFDNGLTVSAFANNVFDARNIQVQLNLGTALEGRYMNRPRTVGVRVDYSF